MVVEICEFEERIEVLQAELLPLWSDKTFVDNKGRLLDQELYGKIKKIFDQLMCIMRIFCILRVKK